MENNLIELAKIEYGEYEEEVIGYEMGISCIPENIWSDNILPLDKLMTEDDFYGELTEQDLINIANNDSDYYWYNNNQNVVLRHVKVINQGWKKELKDKIT